MEKIIKTFGDLVREGRRIGQSGNREEIDRFTAKSHVHSMIMSGRVGASVSDEPEGMRNAWYVKGLEKELSRRNRQRSVLIASLALNIGLMVLLVL